MVTFHDKMQTGIDQQQQQNQSSGGNPWIHNREMIFNFAFFLILPF